MDAEERQSRLWWVAVGAATLAGLALRLAAAQGGLWTDEAWSVIYAAQARDAVGVFLRINHDNNHHLYSLWLQAIGSDASPLVARLPAIIAGTLCVPMAALVVARRSAWAGAVAAILFAVSPTMVNYGSEARGYSLMLLATLGFLWLAAEAVEGRERAGTRWWLALIAALGMLSQMTMAAPVALVALWTYLERRAALGPAAAMRRSVRLMMPALARHRRGRGVRLRRRRREPDGHAAWRLPAVQLARIRSGAQRHDRLDGGARPAARLGRAGGHWRRPRCGSARGRRNGSAGGPGCTPF